MITKQAGKLRPRHTALGRVKSPNVLHLHVTPHRPLQRRHVGSQEDEGRIVGPFTFHRTTLKIKDVINTEIDFFQGSSNSFEE